MRSQNSSSRPWWSRTYRWRTGGEAARSSKAPVCAIGDRVGEPVSTFRPSRSVRQSRQNAQPLSWATRRRAASTRGGRGWCLYRPGEVRGGGPMPGPARPTRTGWGPAVRRRGLGGASELADGGRRDVEGVVEAGSGVHEPVDRADEAPDRGGAAAGAVAVRVGLDRNSMRLALDDDAVCTPPSGGFGQSGAQDGDS